MLCETENGGLLREAAERKQDERILVDIRGRDCSAIEVRYHKSCYVNYTNFLVHEKNAPEDQESKNLYQKAYQTFCVEVVENNLIAQKQVKYMTELFNQFVLIVNKEEGLDASNYRRFRLKDRLRKSYPQLVFLKPNIRTKSEIVYVENLTSEDILDEHMTLKGMEDVEDMDYEDSGKTNVSDLNELHVLFNAAVILRNALQKKPGLVTPWPPLASGLTMENSKNVVPVSLFNFLAWMTASSDDAQLEKHINIVENGRHNKLMSIAQDIVHVASDGRKLTPKTISLAMSLRQLTGSSSVLNLVNGLGHCMSHKFVLRHETALAQLSTSDTGTVPLGFSKKVSATLAWDNDDFCEETRSGKGTTHVTGGIILQRSDDTNDQIVGERRNLPRLGSLPVISEETDPYILGRKVTVDLREAITSVPLTKESYMSIQNDKRKQDLAFVISRTVDAFQPLIPNWTGFNTLLASEHIPSCTKIGYLPIINSSPTELSTINTILKRSQEIADKLELKFICLVFDEAIYAKIQQLRWKEPIYFNRFIVRLGEFHMAMSFCGAISKLFKDAGLKVKYASLCKCN